MVRQRKEDSAQTEANQTSSSNETTESSDNSTANASLDIAPSQANSSSNHSSNSTTNSSGSETETESHSVAYYYPYWRALREPKKSSEEPKKPYEPRPAKFKNNYEDQGIEVFKPEGFKPFIGSFGEKYIPKSEPSDSKTAESAEDPENAAAQVKSSAIAQKKSAAKPRSF